MEPGVMCVCVFVSVCGEVMVLKGRPYFSPDFCLYSWENEDLLILKNCGLFLQTRIKDLRKT